MANTKLPARLLDTSAIPALNVTGDLTVDTTTLKVDSTNNRVGIGIASPDSQLHVHGVGAILSSDSYFVAQIQTDRNDDGSNDDGILQFVNGSAKTVKGEIRWDESTNTFELGHGDNQGHLVIASGGNVGIGTDAPLTALEVHGTSTNAYGTPQLAITGRANANHYFNIGFGYTTGTTKCPAEIGFYENVSSANTKGSLVFATRDVTSDTVPTERMRIDSAGNVGIGDANPQHPFKVHLTNGELAMFGSNGMNSIGQYAGIGLGQVLANSTTYQKVAIVAEGRSNGNYVSNLHFLVDTAADSGSAVLSDSKMMISGGNGNVGIGTDSPTHLLQISGGASDGRMSFTNNSRGNGQADGMWVGVDNTQSFLLSRGAYPLTFYTNATPRMQIDSVGRVTMPYQPTWGAQSLSNAHTSGATNAAGTLVFSGVINNNGNHYSNSTGLFTAPVAGQYYVTFSGLYDDSANVTGPAYIRRNTSNLYRGYHQNSGSSYLQISMSGVVECSVGDSISIYSGMAGWHIGGETSWSGFLIG